MKLTTNKKIFDKKILKPGMAIKYKGHWTFNEYTNAIIKDVKDEALYVVEISPSIRSNDIVTKEIKITDSSVSTIKILKDNATTIQIEDFYGNTIMDFTINNDLDVVSMNECEIADKDEDETGRPIVRLQSLREQILTDSKFNTTYKPTESETIKQTPHSATFNDLKKSHKDSK